MASNSIVAVPDYALSGNHIILCGYRCKGISSSLGEVIETITVLLFILLVACYNLEYGQYVPFSVRISTFKIMTQNEQSEVEVETFTSCAGNC
jgi:hypothetical protein